MCPDTAPATRKAPATGPFTLANGRRGGNETRHLPDGEGTLRAEPLGDALAQFDRPATVISESPDEVSHQAIRAILRSEQRTTYY